jgi:inner membrane protein
VRYHAALDNATHALVGLMLSRAGLNRFAPRASLLMILAADAPDMDGVAWLFGSESQLQHHRGYTHAWLFLPLVAVLPVLVTWFFRNKDQPFIWWKAYVASTIGVASHILLDLTNAYGTRTMLPFSTQWYAWSTTFIVDPWIWGVLALAIGAPFISSLVSGEIGARKSSGQGWAIFALLFIVVYNAGRSLAHDRAIEILNTRIYNGETPRRVGAFPEFANPMRWNAVVELPNSYWVSSVNLLEEFDPGAGRTFFKSPLTPEIEAARKSKPFQVFMDFSEWQLWRAIPMPSPEGAVRVQLLDLRFGDPVEPGFIAEATVLLGPRVEASEFRFSTPKLQSRNR